MGSGRTNLRRSIDKHRSGNKHIHIIIMPGPERPRRVTPDKNQGSPGEQTGEFPGLVVDALVGVQDEGGEEEDREDDGCGLVGGVEEDAAVDVGAGFRHGGGWMRRGRAFGAKRREVEVIGLCKLD